MVHIQNNYNCFVVIVLVSSFRVSRSRVPSPLDVEKYGHPYVTPGETLKDMLDQSSGSGSGLPLLVSKNTETLGPVKGNTDYDVQHHTKVLTKSGK